LKWIKAATSINRLLAEEVDARIACDRGTDLIKNLVLILMAVDVMHLDPGQSFAKMAFGKCQSTEELSREHAFPTVVVSPSDSPTSTHSLMDLSLTSTEQQAVERLQSSRNQLQQEIEVRSGRYVQPALARWCDRIVFLMSMG